MTGTPRPCPSCGAQRAVPALEPPSKADLEGAPLRIVRCVACGTLYQPRRFSSDVIARHYEYMGRPDPAGPLLRRRLRRLLSPLERVRTHGRLLDVGCGIGGLLEVAAELGWTPFATEVSASCCAQLRPRLHDRLHEGELTGAPFAAGSFDAVVLVEVIEHLLDPRDYLAAAHKLLRPGGALLLTTPNVDGSSARLLGSRWRSFANEHLCYFGPRTLGALLERTGFRDVRIRCTGLDLASYRFALHPGHASPGPATDRRPGAAPAARPSLRDALVDLGLEAMNVPIAALRAGDTLKAIAYRSR